VDLSSEARKKEYNIRKEYNLKTKYNLEAEAHA
jgi:hypothetical protein